MELRAANERSTRARGRPRSPGRSPGRPRSQASPISSSSRPHVTITLALRDSVNLAESLMPLAVGDRLGPYEILAPIGAGGMGEVYLGRDTRLGREVAIKASRQEFHE